MITMSFKEDYRVEFGKLMPGDTFLYDGNLYIKTRTVLNTDSDLCRNALRFTNAEYLYFDSELEVEPVDIAITVSRKEPKS